MMSLDEIRMLNWCDACQGRHLTPGWILAEKMERYTVNPARGQSWWLHPRLERR
jgi:hypothetical protein